MQLELEYQKVSGKNMYQRLPELTLLSNDSRHTE